MEKNILNDEKLIKQYLYTPLNVLDVIKQL